MIKPTCKSASAQQQGSWFLCQAPSEKYSRINIKDRDEELFEINLC